MNFADAVGRTPEIAECLKNGLQALKRQDRNQIRYNASRDLKGSVDIDACLRDRYPTEPRWDYVFGYKNRVYYMEIHPAGSTGEVKRIVAKLEWLKQWRKLSAPSLGDLEGQSTYHWISTGKTASSVKKGKYLQILAQNGIHGPDAALNADAVP